MRTGVAILTRSSARFQREAALNSNFVSLSGRILTRPLFAALAFAVVLPILSGCRSGPEDLEDRQSDPQIIYERARKSLGSQDYNTAIRIYTALTSRYPFAEPSRQARLDLIYAYYKSRENESAIDAAETFIRENPTHPRVDYAWYIKGLVDFERTPNALERFFDVDLTERPPQTARKAFAAFRTVVEQFPKSEYAHDSRRRMVYLRNRLADYELNVARYYIRRGAFVAAAQRAKQTIEQYDGSPAVREALEIMIVSYDQLKLGELAAQTRGVYKENYNEDPPAPGERPSRGGAWWKPWS
jgi:outer membrane protein assembly factor BamD